MTAISHRFVEASGLRVHLAEQGTGPLVVLCHGFPESWYSWRHQLAALAAAGFRAVAPDMRGYGQTARPEAVDRYTLLHLVGDVIGVLDALGAETAVVVGHDWGAPVAWHAALLRPDRVRGVVALSVPFRPWRPVRPTSVMPRTDDAVFYQLYFQEPGVAEAELERDPRESLRRILYTGSGDAPPGQGLGDRPEGIAMVPRSGGFLGRTVDPPVLPAWLTEADLDVYAGEFARTGFRGGLNWYRNIDRNWELLAPWAGARVTVPALYVAGDRDLVVRFPGMDQLIPNLSKLVPELRRTIMLPGCGHWTQQERPAEVNAALLDFLHELHPGVGRASTGVGRASAPEQRRHERFHVRWQVTVFVDEHAVVGHTTDVSTQGLRIVLPRGTRLELGRAYRIEVRPDTQPPFTCLATAVHTSDAGSGFATMQVTA